MDTAEAIPPSVTPCCPLGGQKTPDVESSLSGFFGHLFDTSSYPARWKCGSWTPLEGWLHIASDVGIFLAYFAIPIALVYFVSKRKDVPFNGIFVLFAVFIMSCGAGHLLEAVIFYYPVYRLAGLLKLVTAIVSWVTVLALFRLIPKALELPALASKNELLRQADEAKSEFLANMSHEIRTPMTAILGFTDILTANVSKPENLDAARTIRRNGEYLLDLINDILDLSKIEAGKLEIERREFSPSSVIDDVVSLMRLRAESKGLLLRVRYDGTLPGSIENDPTRMRQVLINIVGNAIKFTQTGSVQIVVSMATQTHADQLLRVNVSDTGIGIAADKITKLFTPFTQADSSTTRKFGGTGLGLAISKRLAQALGGDMTITSALGRGTTISTTFAIGAPDRARPAHHQPEDVAAENPVVGLAEECDLPQLEGRVLLVEDGPDNQRLISYILRKAGAVVDIAENGQIALDRALAASHGNQSRQEDSAGTYDVILMDMQMPVMDGYTAARKLREAGYLGPIIALTAHAMLHDRSKCLEAGCDEYLTKPISRNQLLNTVRRFSMLSKSTDDGELLCLADDART